MVTVALVRVASAIGLEKVAVGLAATRTPIAPAVGVTLVTVGPASGIAGAAFGVFMSLWISACDKARL